MSPTLSLQIYARPFVSAGDYTNFKELVDGRADGLRRPVRAVRLRRRSPTSTVRSFRTTNVLRWEYRPGSALFVVWQQGRDEFAQLGHVPLRPRLRPRLQRPATNLFLVKMSYWLNY